MNNFTIILISILFLLILWTLTYRNVLLHIMTQIAISEDAIREKFFVFFNKLPYFLQMLGEHKIKSDEILELRSILVGSVAKFDEVFEKYVKLYSLAEEFMGAGGKDLQSDIGFLEVKGELNDLHDEIRLLAKEHDEHVRKFNGKLMKFPSHFVGGLFKYAPREELS